jgi:HlyD family secretion protein
VWKWLIGIFLVFVLALGAGGYFFATSPQFAKYRKQFSGGAKVTKVRLEPAAKGTLIRSVSAPGSVESETAVKISAQVSAKVTALPFREGEDVKTDDVIVRLDSRDLEASVESVQAQQRSEEARLAGAQAALERSRQDVERQRALASTHDVAPQVLETAESDFRQADSQVQAIKQSIAALSANIRRAQRDLENTTIRSPMDGTITSLTTEVGEQVLGTFQNAGTVIMEIADLTTMVVKARVDESMVAPVKEGQHARVYINMYPDRVFDGEVKLVGLRNISGTDGTRYVEVEIALKLKPGERLRTGLTANVDIEVETLYDVIKVPSQAVVDRRLDDLPSALRDSPVVDKSKPFARVVFTLKEGKASAIPVSIGASDLTHTVILAGLEADTPIIAGPFKVLVDIKDGKEVVEESAEPADDKGKQDQLKADKGGEDKGPKG